MFNMKVYYKIATIFFILTVYIFSGYSFPEAKQSYKVLLSTKSKGYPEKYNKKLAHPYDISETILKKILSNIYYIQKKSGRGWQNEKRVFSNSFSKKASIFLKTALRKASSRQKVVLVKMGSNGETICDIFVKEEILNFKFSKINGLSTTHHTWRLAPKLAQHFYKPPKTNMAVSILTGGRYKDYTWITISLLEYEEGYQVDLKSPSQSGIVTKNKGKEQSSQALNGNNANQLNKLERMKSLKVTFESKLINLKDYRKKAISLLKSPTKVKMTLRDELIFLKILKNEGFISEDYFEQKKDVLLENL